MNLLPSSIVLVNQDNVIADFEREFNRRWIAKKHPELPFIAPEQRTSFRISDDYPEEYRSLIEAVFHEQGFYRSIPLVPYAAEALREMSEYGFNVFICTSSPLTKNPWCASEKLEWITEHFGIDFRKRTIISDDKTIIHGDVLIDDKLHISGIRTPDWEHVVFEAPANKRVADNRRRIRTWREWKRVLLCQEAQCS